MRDIKGYEGLYAVTSCGKVWSYRRKKFLKPYSDKKGYLKVGLCKNGERCQMYVHRLVAQAYISNPENLPQINHKDEVKTHNWINNLEWCDNKYNTRYSQAKKVRCIETKQIFNCITDAANFVNRRLCALSACLNGRTTTCGGYHWEYVKEGL